MQALKSEGMATGGGEVGSVLNFLGYFFFAKVLRKCLASLC